MDKFTNIIRDFNIFVLKTDRTSGHKTSLLEGLSNAVNQLALLYNAPHATAAHTFLSRAHEAETAGGNEKIAQTL